MWKIWVTILITVLSILSVIFLTLIFTDYFIHLVSSSTLVAIFLILLQMNFYRQDTQLPGSFFLIDRVRTVRFATFYHFALSIFAIIVIFISPGLLYVLSVVILFIVIAIANLGILILSIFTNLSNFIDFENALWEFDIGFLSYLGSQEIFYILAYTFSFIAGSFGGYFLAKYIEDIKTGIFIISHNYLLVLSLIIVSYPLFLPINISVYNGVQQLFLLQQWSTYQLKTIAVLLPIVLSFINSVVIYLLIYNRKINSDYDLPIIHNLFTYTFRIITLSAFIFYSAISIMIVSLIFSNFSTISDLPFVIFPILLGLFGIFRLGSLNIYGLRGDYPVDQRLFEIEYREELLMKAEKYRLEEEAVESLV